jgi:tRNA A-37 threonylcarbamoyl transferase component Bud32
MPSDPVGLACTCSGCGKRFTVTTYNPARPPVCPECGSRLDPATTPLPVPGRGPVAARTAEPVSAPSVELEPEPSLPPAYPLPFGKYTLRGELGRGGMGVVHEAFDNELQRVVALKTIRPRFYDSPQEAGEDEERFLREARLCAALPKHPHIVTIYDMGAVDRRRYLSMEFIHGRPMHEWARQDGLTLRRKVALLHEIALAVHHAHEHGVIHRDLKPANVLVDETDHPHVTDFGLSKAVSELPSNQLTASGMLVGTPSYMSPEQARGEKGLDRRSDVFALGVMLYEILAGRLPFAAPSPIELLLKIASEAPAPPSRLQTPPDDPAFDARVERICLKSLARDARDRHPTAKALAEDLAGWLAGEPVAEGRRRTLRAAVAGGVVLAVAAAGALVFRGLSTTPPQAPAAPAPPAATAPSPPKPLSDAEAATLAAADRRAIESMPVQDLPGGELRADTAILDASKPFLLGGVLSAGGGDPSEPLTIRVGPGVEIRGTDRSGIDLGQRGRLVIEGTRERPVVLRHLLIGQDLGASLAARHAVFDQCRFKKTGSVFSTHSSKWALEDCLLHRPSFVKLNTIDYGFRWRRCALVEAALPEILFDRFSDPGPQDHGAFVRKEWTTIEACAFLGGAVPPSVLWCTERCRFVRCRFPKGEPFDSEAALDVTADIRDAQGPRPDDPGTQPAPRRAPVRVANAALPPATARFPEQATCPVPELRHDPAFRELFDR